MTAKKPEVIRNASDVSEYELPEWDRHGNRVSATKLNNEQTPTHSEADDEELTESDISAPTLKELEEIREQAYNEGFEQGFEEGLKQGKMAGMAEGKQQGYAEGLTQGKESGAVAAEKAAAESYEKQRRETFAVFIEAVNELKNYRLADQKELENALATLALRLAKQVIQDELRLQPEHIVPVVHATVESLPNPDESLILRLNPLDIPIISEVADSHWQLQPDESISRGGCTLKSGFSYVDYTLEHRFETAIRSVLHHIEEPKNSKEWLRPLSDDALIDNFDVTEADDPVAAELTETPESSPQSEIEEGTVPNHGLETAVVTEDETSELLGEQQGGDDVKTE